MIKLIFHLTVVVAVFLWIGEVKISLAPFSIQLPAWRLSIAWMLFAIGLQFLQDQYTRNGIALGYKAGYDAGYNRAREQVVNIIREEKEKQEENKA